MRHTLQLTLPQNDTDTKRRLQLEKARHSYRYSPNDAAGLPSAHRNALGMLPPGELTMSELGQLLGVGFRLMAGRVRLLWRWGIHALRHPGASSIDRYAELYRGCGGTETGLSDHWQSDDYFGDQRLNGLSPWFLERVTRLPPNFPCTDTLLAGLLPVGQTLLQQIERGRIFITNHHYLSGAAHENAEYLCAPICLFHLLDDGRLIPLAIQLVQDPRQGPIFTPKEPPGLWLSAKIWANCCDLHVTDLYEHITLQHLVMESVWIAVNRTLAEKHPIKAFLRPHFRMLLSSGIGLRSVLSKKGPLARIHAFGSEAGWEFVRRRLKEWSPTKLDVAADFARRGVTEIPGYHYRDDSLQWWDAIGCYVDGVVEAVYPREADVGSDVELNAWAAELREQDCVDWHGVVGSTSFTRDQLKSFLRCLVFAAGPKHSFGFNCAIDHFSFVPNMPAMFKLAPPTEKTDIALTDIARALPGPWLGTLQMAQSECTNRPRSEFNKITSLPDSYMAGAGEGVAAAVRRWQEDLVRIEQELAARNRKLDRPFTYLMPSRCHSSAWL